MKHPMSPETRQQVIERDYATCRYCLAGWSSLEIHHRQGRRVPNPNRLSNLLLLCSACHKRVTEHPAWAYELGLSVRRTGIDQPDEVPYTDCQGVMWGLTDDGQRIRWGVTHAAP